MKGGAVKDRANFNYTYGFNNTEFVAADKEGISREKCGKYMNDLNNGAAAIQNRNTKALLYYR